MFGNTSRIRPFLVCLGFATLLGASCNSSPAAPSETATSSSTTTLTFTAEPSGGFPPSRTYTLQNATFRALSMRSGGAIEIEARPMSPTDKSGPWTFTMGSPFGRGLAPGTYATNPFETDGGYGFLFFGYDHYCGTPGSVTIRNRHHPERRPALPRFVHDQVRRRSDGPRRSHRSRRAVAIVLGV